MLWDPHLYMSLLRINISLHTRSGLYLRSFIMLHLSPSPRAPLFPRPPFPHTAFHSGFRREIQMYYSDALTFIQKSRSWDRFVFIIYVLLLLWIDAFNNFQTVTQHYLLSLKTHVAFNCIHMYVLTSCKLSSVYIYSLCYSLHNIQNY